MDILKEIDGDVLILKVSGDLVHADETMALHDEVKKHIAEGYKKIVLDLGKIQNINSTGLGVLMTCKSSIDEINGRLRLANVSKEVANLLDENKASDHFGVYKTTKQAVKFLKKEEDK